MNERIQNLFSDINLKKLVFTDVIAFIETHYDCSPTSFKNGSVLNAENENQGSAKVLAFAQLNNLNKEDTLRLFIEHYDAVLNNPLGSDHQNIRQFMENGWSGVSFEGQVLQAKG